MFRRSVAQALVQALHPGQAFLRNIVETFCTSPCATIADRALPIALRVALAVGWRFVST